MSSDIERIAFLNQSVQLEALDTEIYEQIINLMPSALIVIDQSQRMRYVNAQATLMFEYPASAMIGQPIHMLLAAEHEKLHTSHIANFFSNPSTRPMNLARTLSGRTNNRGGTGKDIMVQISIGPIVSSFGLLAMASIWRATDAK